MYEGDRTEREMTQRAIEEESNWKVKRWRKEMESAQDEDAPGKTSNRKKKKGEKCARKDGETKGKESYRREKGEDKLA